MRSMLFAAILGVATLGLLGLTPAEVKAQHPFSTFHYSTLPSSNIRFSNYHFSSPGYYSNDYGGGIPSAYYNGYALPAFSYAPAGTYTNYYYPPSTGAYYPPTFNAYTNPRSYYGSYYYP